jgi:hypothetical protein
MSVTTTAPITPDHSRRSRTLRAAGLICAGLATVAAIGTLAQQANPVTPVPATCTFDGGGTIAIGTYDTVTTGQTFACETGGRLVQITLTPPAAPAGVLPASGWTRR